MVTVVFGAGGNVGRYVVAGLKSAGVQVRSTSRHSAAAGPASAPGIVTADLDRPETLGAALEGASRVFLYARPAGIDGFVAAAESAGVRQVVLLSSGAVLDADLARDPIAWSHGVVEAALEKSGLEWTFLRPGMFATNALWWWQESIRAEGVVHLPYPDARTTPVHEQDVAALVVAALTEPGHHGKAYPISGPQPLTLRRQVRHIGEAIGRDISIVETTVDEARTELRQRLPDIAVDGVLAGWQAGVRDSPPVWGTIEQITGRPARTFAQWAEDHAGDFR